MTCLQARAVSWLLQQHTELLCSSRFCYIAKYEPQYPSGHALRAQCSKCAQCEPQSRNKSATHRPQRLSISNARAAGAVPAFVNEQIVSSFRQIREERRENFVPQQSTVHCCAREQYRVGRAPYRFVRYWGIPLPHSGACRLSEGERFSADMHNIPHTMLIREAFCCLAYRTLWSARTGLCKIGYGEQIRALQLTV